MRRAYLENVSDRTLTALKGWPLMALYEMAKLTNYIHVKDSDTDLKIAIDKDGVLHIIEEG